MKEEPCSVHSFDIREHKSIMNFYKTCHKDPKSVSLLYQDGGLNDSWARTYAKRSPKERSIDAILNQF